MYLEACWNVESSVAEKSKEGLTLDSDVKLKKTCSWVWLPGKNVLLYYILFCGDSGPL